jgi:Fe-S cluster biogenesis protein NfuA
VAQNGLPLIKGSPSSLENSDASRDPIIRQIVAILEKQVRPVLANDGGDVSFESFNNGVVYVRLMGACSGCPGAAATLKSGIENMLRYYVPEVLEVRSLNT